MKFDEIPFNNSEMLVAIVHFDYIADIVKKCYVKNIDVAVKDIIKNTKLPIKIYNYDYFNKFLTYDEIISFIKTFSKYDPSDNQHYINNIMFYNIVKEVVSHIRYKFLNQLVDLGYFDLIFDSSINEFVWKMKPKGN